MRILHILSYIDQNNKYGGPVSVARQLALKLSNNGHQVVIHAGSDRDFQVVVSKNLEEKLTTVHSFSSRHFFSGLFSINFVLKSLQDIRRSDVVHIHFARETIPIVTAFLCIIFKKPYLTQTHGMIVRDGRIITRFIDKFACRPIMARARINLALSQMEISALKSNNMFLNTRIIGNGISQYDKEIVTSREPTIIFCSRIHPQKNLKKFIELANLLRNERWNFDVYGSDAGDLKANLNLIEQLDLRHKVTYRGKIRPEDVREIFSRASLLVLPSKGDQYPMVVLEALSVGTPVLIMPSCGIAREVSEISQDFVASSENLDALTKAANKLLRNPAIDYDAIAELCLEYFDIEKIANQLESHYELMTQP